MRCVRASGPLARAHGHQRAAPCRDKKIAQELEQENKELMLKRKARLRSFLEAEAQVFEAQLNTVGKAFCKER